MDPAFLFLYLDGRCCHQQHFIGTLKLWLEAVLPVVCQDAELVSWLDVMTHRVNRHSLGILDLSVDYL